MGETGNFYRSLKTIEGVRYFVTTCQGCGACYGSRTISKMPRWEADHCDCCPALEHSVAEGELA